jgi:hypothetical protein
VVDLAVVPHEASHLVVIGATVRKSPAIVAAWLQSLAWQVQPRQVQRFYLFIDDASPPETRALLNQFVAERGGLVWDAEPAPVVDFADNGDTHEWTGTAMDRVGRSKDRILEFARQNRAEAVWLTDSDLIMDPMTLTSLWSVPNPITAAVYWTRWQVPPPESPPLHAGPQVWLRHPYGLAGLGMDEWEFRRRLVDRRITKVLGLGACTLIRRDALMRGVSFAPWPGNTMQGIGQGEDRHFCLRADALHIELTADPWADVFHIYHSSDEALIPQMLERLSRDPRHLPDGEGQPLRPSLGDLVSLDLHPLELIVWPPPENPSGSRWLQHAPPHLVRGRLGKLALVPELEDAVLQMTRGEVRVVPVHFPLDYPFEQYRGQRRLIRVTLIDHKPFGFPPVVEDELLVNRIGGALDTTTLTPELIEQIKEVHA